MKKDKGKDNNISHPSFALISVARSTGTSERVFGSTMPVHSRVSLEISEAEMVQDPMTKKRYYHERKRILSLTLTPLQFAQLFCSLNHGNGVPCTINHRDGKQIEPYDQETTLREEIVEKFRLQMCDLTEGCVKLLTIAKELQAKPNVNKADRAEFSTLAENPISIFNAQVPYLAEQFSLALEHMEAELKSDTSLTVSSPP